jgi:integrase
MRNPNGWGGVSKLPGNRRRPWRVRITSGWTADEDGKARQQYKTIGYYSSREEAMTALAEYNSNPYDIDTAVTFAELYRKWSAEKYPTISKSNVQGYEASYKVCSKLYDMRFADIRRIHMQDVVDNCGKAYPTLRKLKVLFSQLYTYAVQNDICDKDYSDFVDITKHKDTDSKQAHTAFTSVELDAIWGNRDRSPYIGIVNMLIYSGVRISELLDLRKSDVHMAERYFDVKESKTAAGIRKVPIAEKVLYLWEYWMNQPGEYVLQRDPEIKFEYSAYYRTYFVQPLTQIGLPDTHRPHDTRHTCISLLVAAGINKTLIKRIVGHQGEDVTDNVYTHFDVQQLIDAINKI